MATVRAVTLRRGPCFGSCPIYEVTLRSSGSAEWLGEAFVDRLGAYRGKLARSDFKPLADSIERSGFFNWDEKYRPVYEITDHPTYLLHVTRGRRTKSVEQYATDEPADFGLIAALVDALAEKVTWTPIKLCVP